MMRRDDLERTLDTWFAASAVGPEPAAVLATVLERTRASTPRRGWVVRLRGGGMGARARTRPRLGRPVAIMLVLVLLAGLALAAAMAVGDRPSPRPAGGSNGWIAFAANRNPAPGEYRDIYLAGDGLTTRRIIGSDDDGVSQGCPRFSPDGSMLAYGEGDESVDETDMRGRWPITGRAVVVVGMGADGEPSPALTRIDLPAVPGPLPCPEWSVDGDHLAYFTGTELQVADVRSGATTAFAVESVPGDPVWESLEFVWSPDGTAILVAEPTRVRSIRIDGAGPTVIDVAGAWGLTPVADGQRIIYVFNDNDGGDAIRSLEMATGADRLLRADGAGDLVASADGTRLAYKPGDAEISVMDIDGNDIAQVRTSPTASKLLLWSPDGRRLLLGGARGLASVGVDPAEPEVRYPSSGLAFEWFGADHVSWQAVPR